MPHFTSILSSLKSLRGTVTDPSSLSIATDTATNATAAKTGTDADTDTATALPSTPTCDFCHSQRAKHLTTHKGYRFDPSTLPATIDVTIPDFTSSDQHKNPTTGYTIPTCELRSFNSCHAHVVESMYDKNIRPIIRELLMESLVPPGSARTSLTSTSGGMKNHKDTYSRLKIPTGESGNASKDEEGCGYGYGLKISRALSKAADSGDTEAYRAAAGFHDWWAEKAGLETCTAGVRNDKQCKIKFKRHMDTSSFDLGDCDTPAFSYANWSFVPTLFKAVTEVDNMRVSRSTNYETIPSRLAG